MADAGRCHGAAESTTVVKGRLSADAPAGSHAVDLAVEVRNLQPQSGTALAASLPLSITVGR